MHLPAPPEQWSCIRSPCRAFNDLKKCTATWHAHLTCPWQPLNALRLGGLAGWKVDARPSKSKEDSPHGRQARWERVAGAAGKQSLRCGAPCLWSRRCSEPAGSLLDDLRDA